MKVVLKFNLPDERTEAELALHGPEWSAVVWEMDTYLRNKVKYQGGGEEVQEIRDYLHAMLADRNLELI